MAFSHLRIMKNDVNIDFGKRIAELRKKANLSQEKFAFKCDVDRTYIGTLERGEKSPTLNTIEKIARALGISKSELFNY
jgi:transcriptional regulator with XRE-family HTH domain